MIPTPAVVQSAVPNIDECAITRPRTPFAVERFPAPKGWVNLVAYDGRGEFMAQFVIPTRKFSDQTTARLRRWAMKNDDTVPPTLSLLD